MKRHYIILLLLTSVTEVTTAQKKFTLSECYQYARKNNPSLLRSQNQVSAGHIDLQLSKLKRLPSASINAEHYFAFGKNIDPVTNNFVTERFSGGYAGLGAQLNIISGFNTLYSIKQNKYSLKAAQKAQQRAELEVESAISLAYSKLLYSKEQAGLIRKNIEKTKTELEITNEKIIAGKVTRNEYYQVNARLQTELADLITAQNDSLYAGEELKQLMGLAYTDEFDITPLDSSAITEILNVIIMVPEMLEKILSDHPAIGEARMNAEAIRMGIHVARSYLYPSLSLRGNLFSNYNIDQTGNNGEKIPLYPQLNNNFGQNISIIFKAPVFSQMHNAGKIKKEKINLNNAALQIKETENIVIKNTLQLINDFNAAKQKYIATLSALQQNDLSYSIITEKYKLGMLSSLELITSKDLLSASLTRHLHARIDLFFKHKLIQLLRE
jgi:outer membrane protein